MIGRASRKAIKSPLGDEKGGVASVIAPAAPPPIETKAVFERAVFELADELDVPARRLRSGMVKLMSRMREVGISLDAAEKHLEPQADLVTRSA